MRGPDAIVYFLTSKALNQTMRRFSEEEDSINQAFQSLATGGILLGCEYIQGAFGLYPELTIDDERVREAVDILQTILTEPGPTGP